jgi:hypothetical protein
MSHRMEEEEEEEEERPSKDRIEKMLHFLENGEGEETAAVDLDQLKLEAALPSDNFIMTGEEEVSDAKTSNFRSVRVRLHESDSAYKSRYDSMQDLHTKGFGFGLSFRHRLKPFVKTFH